MPPPPPSLELGVGSVLWQLTSPGQANKGFSLLVQEWAGDLSKPTLTRSQNASLLSSLGFLNHRMEPQGEPNATHSLGPG